MLTVGKHNIIHGQLVDKEKIVFPLLHIRLGLMKQFAKALDKDGACFQDISDTFPCLSKEKKKKMGIFDDPHIHQLIQDKNFA